MPDPTMQIVIDCADPHTLGDFWADAFGYEVEEAEDVIARMLEQGHATDEDVTRHRGRRVWRTATALSDPAGRLPRLLFQWVPEEKVGKNRVHVDVHVGPDQRDSLVERLVASGAERLWDGRQGPNTWVTMADPEGNEFCIS